VGRIIENMDEVTTAIASRDDALDELLVNLGSLSGDLAERNDSLNRLVVDFTDVQTRLARLLRDNRGNIDGAVDDLRVIADTLARHRDDLEAGLATLPEGVGSYHLISSFGQWFNVRATVVCLAGQTTCFTEDATHNFGTPETISGPAVERSVTDIVRFANAGAPLS
jgi:ABC-type transporter Mla subunit MlaD